MTCELCEGRGWIEGWQGASATWTPSLQQCRRRCNIAGYSREVQRRLNTPQHATERQVLKSQPSQTRLATVTELRPRDRE